MVPGKFGEGIEDTTSSVLDALCVRALFQKVELGRVERQRLSEEGMAFPISM
jgi:hypothetical protein